MNHSRRKPLPTVTMLWMFLWKLLEKHGNLWAYDSLKRNLWNIHFRSQLPISSLSKFRGWLFQEAAIHKCHAHCVFEVKCLPLGSPKVRAYWCLCGQGVCLILCPVAAVLRSFPFQLRSYQSTSARSGTCSTQMKISEPRKKTKNLSPLYWVFGISMGYYGC